MATRNTVPGLNTGLMFEPVRQKRRVTHAVLARRTGRSQSTVKNLLSGSSVQTHVVWEFSVALKHNFFADLARQLDAATEGRLDQELTELQKVKEECQRLREERDYLRKAIDMIRRD